MKVQRHPERAVKDRAAALAILDEGLICHVGFVVDDRPWVIPTMYAREGEVLFLHGSPASRMLRGLAGGIDVSVTVTLLDGLVLARSAFSHSMNYRSVVIAGTATEVVDPDAKVAAMRCLVEHVFPGRWDEVRQPSAKEIATTLVDEGAQRPTERRCRGQDAARVGRRDSGEPCLWHATGGSARRELGASVERHRTDRERRARITIRRARSDAEGVGAVG
jgi:nitroimidazol reductase NimA-like FMN-containing flavoprotein (pyridoxamine 5'-phosphate oxidase superfamily)